MLSDIYFTGTRLRLRRMVDRRGERPTIYKFTQKASGLITNTYLAEDEYRLLAQLPGHELRKIRYSLPPFGIDVFLPPHDGLVLAEAEFETDEEMAAAAGPPGAVAEVTDDERYTGGYLAAFSSRSKP